MQIRPLFTGLYHSIECLYQNNSKFSFCLMDQANVFKNKNKIDFPEIRPLVTQ